MRRPQPKGMNNSRSDNENALRKLVLGRIQKLGIRPNENLGQHFLVDQASVDLLTQSVNPGNTAIEIGAGVGQLTQALAQRANKVISVEIDRRYEPDLTQITRQYPNVKVIFGDALALRFGDFIPRRREDTGVQIVASLPFHITEPFLHKIAGLPIENATLVVGQRLMYTIQASSEESRNFGQLTLLTQTFFDTDVISTIEKKKFYPVPRIDSAIVRLTPKKENEFRSNRRDFLLRRLFVTAKRSPLVKNALKEGLTEERFLTQNQARAIIEKMGIPDSILDKPLQQLNNSELRILSKALRFIIDLRY